MFKKLWIGFLVAGLLIASLACQFSVNLPGLKVWEGAQAEVTPEAIPTPTIAPPLITVPPNAGSLQPMEGLLTELYARVSPGVVAIRTIGAGGGGLGSGFIYDNTGHIVTNYHVIENTTDLEIHFPSGLKVHGKVIGTDLDSDLAVIQVEVPQTELHPLALGDSGDLKIGQQVVAIGNPYGLSGTMTLGIVSAKGRTLDSMRPTTQGTFFAAGDIIQTDASINPGNSGGPLLNLNGQVIGVNRAIRAAGVTPQGDPLNTGIGFAISVNIVKRVVPVLIQNGFVEYTYLGISA
ncbi:MAG: trypsin-like peptidase domain-containing protein, partial [Anaerolineaceae bacterium]|nr:trypsin-like peptidase domain-containing protein [Anaerolineaceae bacterium]